MQPQHSHTTRAIWIYVDQTNRSRDCTLHETKHSDRALSAGASYTKASILTLKQAFRSSKPSEIVQVKSLKQPQIYRQDQLLTFPLREFVPTKLFSLLHKSQTRSKTIYGTSAMVNLQLTRIPNSCLNHSEIIPFPLRQQIPLDAKTLERKRSQRTPDLS